MLQFLNLKKEAFGIDISDLSLKFVKLKNKGNFLGLASFGESVIEPGIIEEGEVRNEKKLAELVKTAISKAKGEKLKIREVVASLPEEKAFLQVIQLPLMEKRELNSAVRFEAENYVPLPLEEVYLDFKVVSSPADKLDHFDVLIAAQPKKIVDGYVAVLRNADLIPRVLEIESQAIARALIRDEASHSPLLMIDMGATKTSLIVFSGRSLRFTTSITTSSQKFTEAIAKALKLNLKDAEKLKIKHGVGGEENQAVFTALTPVLNDLISHIKTYLDYYQTHASHEHLLSKKEEGIKKIFLCGGGANIKGLTDFLSKELKITVELGNPWINILPRPLKEVPELSYPDSLKYTTALGLALRSIRENRREGPQKARI